MTFLSVLFLVLPWTVSQPARHASGQVSSEVTAPITVSDSLAYLAFSPGEVVPEAYLRRRGAAAFFRISPVPDSIFAVMKGRSYKADCTTPRGELRYLRLLHRRSDGAAVVGELVVNRLIANDVLDIFRELYANDYPIEQMRLVDYWEADDERSMAANNTSAFNFRRVSHSRRVSKHGLGMAIDINPLYNPCRRVLKNGKVEVEPAAGRPYADRNKAFPYKIERGDLCYRLFLAKGFRWGGDWKHTKDYQHFER